MPSSVSGSQAEEFRPSLSGVTYHDVYALQRAALNLQLARALYAEGQGYFDLTRPSST